MHMSFSLVMMAVTPLVDATPLGRSTLRCNVSAVELRHYTQPDRLPYVTRIVRKSRFAALERTHERTFCIITPLVLTLTNPYQWVDCAVCPSQTELNEALLEEAKHEFDKELAAHDAELMTRTERALNAWWRLFIAFPLGITVPVLCVLVFVCINEHQYRKKFDLNGAGSGAGGARTATCLNESTYV
jgi:hypothetical protein